MEIKKLRLGELLLPSNVLMAPLAGYTCYPFRMLAQELGAGLCFTEMVSANGLKFKDRATRRLLFTTEDEKIRAVQLLGGDPAVMERMAGSGLLEDADIIDINMGCPVPKVVKNGEGSALMKDPGKVYEIVNQTVKAIRKPVTVKIRKGFDDGCINAAEIAKVIEAAGGAAVAVHGRTREQYYSGRADWEIIRRVKEAVSIPVIGNGDVVSGETAQAMMRQTGCDGVMIGRAAQGNPWIFRELAEYEKTGKRPARPSGGRMKEAMLRHARLQMEFKGDYIGIREMRKHVSWYTKGMEGSAKLRDAVNRVESYEELKELLDSVLD